MLDATVKLISAALETDGTLSTEDKKRIVTALKPSDEIPIKLVTSRVACQMLDCSRRTLYTWEQQGKIRAIRRGLRSIRYSLFDIQRFMREGAAEQAVKGGK